MAERYFKNFPTEGESLRARKNVANSANLADLRSRGMMRCYFVSNLGVQRGTLSAATGICLVVAVRNAFIKVISNRGVWPLITIPAGLDARRRGRAAFKF